MSSVFVERVLWCGVVLLWLTVHLFAWNVINVCISHVIITLMRYFLIPRSRDLVSHNPGISGLKNGSGIPGLQSLISRLKVWQTKYWHCMLTPNTLIFPFLRLCQFWWKSIKKCDRESAHGRTHCQTQTGFISCPMLYAIANLRVWGNGVEM